MQLESAQKLKLERQADQVSAEANEAVTAKVSMPSTLPATESPDHDTRKRALCDKPNNTGSRKSARLAAPEVTPASSHTHDMSKSSHSEYVPGKFDGADIDSIPCEDCGVSKPLKNNVMVICDACNKGYHSVCYKIAVVPDEAHDWICSACIRPGMCLSIYHKTVKQWRDCTVRAQMPRGQGTEVAYDDGERALEDLNSYRWRPLHERNLNAIISLAHLDEDISPTDTIWLATTPRSLAHLNKFPKSVQEKWRRSRLKEFNSIIGKKAAEVIDKSRLPTNAIIIPAAWVFKIKADGTLKSRLVLLGHLMPKDGEL